MATISLLLLIPLLGGIATLALSRGERADRTAKTLGMLFSVAAFVFSLILWVGFDPSESAGGLQFVERYAWIDVWGISYFVGIDGLSLLLVILTTFLTPIVLLSSFSAVEQRMPLYIASMLFLETAMIGALVAVDLFLFYVFWEVMLVPMYLLVGIWGGTERIYAAVKFFLYTMVGSLLMLLAMIAVVYLHYDATGTITFSLLDLLATPMSFQVQIVLFAAFFLAFAIKVPLFPLHTWLPDAHVQAPTGGSVILAGVLLKMGTYAIARFAMPLFPAAALASAPWISLLAVIGIIYGALVAMVQPDVKKLVAYSSVSHLGFVVLGLMALTPEAFQGALIQNLNHGISTGALFLLVGVIYERRHTREIAAFGGLAKVMPAFTALFMIVTLSSVALPGTNGFIGEFLILIGSFTSKGPWMQVLTALAASGVIFSAVYMLWMVQRVFFGPVENEENRGLTDLNRREWGYMVPLIILIFVIGLLPGPFLRTFDSSTTRFLERFGDDAVLASLPQEDIEGRARVAELLEDRRQSDDDALAVLER